MSQSGAIAGERASVQSAGAPASPRMVARVEALIEAGRRRQAVQSPSLWESALEFLRGLTKPATLRHGIAAMRRGNLEAAFGLLREEVAARPDRAESTQLLWEVALSLGRASDAAAPLARLLRHLVSQGAVEQGTDHFVALAEAVPETVVDVGSLARIVPVLRTRLNAARGEKAQAEARERLCDALRRSVDPRSGALPPPVALRIMDEAKGLDLEVAKRAAQIALESTSLHEAKRQRVQELLEAFERGEWPEGPEGAIPVPVSAPPAPARAPQAPVAAAVDPAPEAPRAKPAAAKPAAARPAAAKPAAAKPAAKKPAAATKPAEKPAPKPVVPPEEKAAPAPGRKTVALTQDEIDAASTRLAERMAAKSAARSAVAPPPPVRPPRPVAPAPELEPELEPEIEPEALADPEPQAGAEDPTPDPEATIIGVRPAAPAPPAAPAVADAMLDEETLDDDGDFALGGDLEDEDDERLEVEPEDEDFALGITDMGPVLEVDEAERAAAAAAAAAPEDEIAVEAVEADVNAITDGEAVAVEATLVEDDGDAEEAVEVAPLAEDEDDDADFAIGIDSAAPTPEADAPIDEADLTSPDDESGISGVFGSSEDEELTPDEAPPPVPAVEAEFGADGDLAAAVDEKPEPEAVVDDDANPLAELVDEALAGAGGGLRAIDITPVEIGDDGLVAYEVAQSQRTRIDYRAIEAVSVAEVSDLGAGPGLVIYLVLRARAGRPRSALRLCCDAFDAASLYPDRTSDGDAVRAMLADLLERTRALPLPDPDSALGLRPQQFERVADFEAAILERLPS